MGLIGLEGDGDFGVASGDEQVDLVGGDGDGGFGEAVFDIEI